MHMPKQQTSQAGASGHLTSRFTVDGKRRGLYECPDGGIVLDASRIDLGDALVAIVLITDMSGMTGGRNCGTSASNALPTIAVVYQRMICETLGVDDIIWIERDSMGCFDRVLVNIANDTPSITWQPLLSGAFTGRTEEDFRALFGTVADRALTNAYNAVRLTRCATSAAFQGGEG